MINIQSIKETIHGLYKECNFSIRPDYIIQLVADLNTKDNRQRAITIFLPFFSLHSKTAPVVAQISGAYQLYSIWSNDGKTKDKALQTAFLVGSVGLGTIFPSGQLIFSSVVFFAQHAQKLKTGENWKETTYQIVSQIVHLASTYYGTPKWVVLSLLSQAASEVYKGYTQEKTPEKIAAFVMAGIRGYRAYSHADMAFKIPETRGQPKPEETEFCLQKISNVSSLEHSENLLDRLSEKIDAKATSIFEEQQRKFKTLSFFHGYGKSIVKGMNLRFKYASELTFRINHVYRERLEKIIDAIRSMSSEDRNDFIRQFQFENKTRISLSAKSRYTVGVSTVKDPVEKFLSDPKELSCEFTFDDESGASMSFEIGTGEYHSLNNLIRIRLSNTPVNSFQRVLSVFGLEDVLEKSTPEDIERMKTGILYRTFFPKNAYALERSSTFFELPIHELKQKMIDDAPQMKEIFTRCVVESTELFLEYFRYGVSIHKKVSELGARALSCSITGISGGDYDEKPKSISSFSYPDLYHLSSILKNGLLSSEFRSIGGQEADITCYYWDGGAHSVFTQMVTQNDLNQKKRLSSFGYESPVRLYLSLTALNRGSYQYFDPAGGTRAQYRYGSRLNILDFTEQNPSEFQEHEVMIPDRVLPTEIKAMSIQSETLKQQLIKHLRECHLIQADEKGQEKINGIPLNEFFRTEDHITPDLVKNCYPKLS